MNAAWNAFVRSVDASRLEAERYNQPMMSERPGSSADLAMRTRHEIEAMSFRFDRRHPKITPAARAAVIAESEAFDRAARRAKAARALERANDPTTTARGQFTARQWAIGLAWAERNHT